MTDSFKVSTANFASLLLNRDLKYTIPLFQRSYCWEPPQLEMLFEDVESLFPRLSAERDKDEDTRFLGAIILTRGESSGADQLESFGVIDGQQRLVTLFVLLCCLARLCTEIADAIVAAADEDKSKRDFGEKLRRKAVTIAKGLIASRGEDENKAKIHPSWNDRLEFDDAIEQLGFLKPLPKKFDVLGAEVGGALERAIEVIVAWLNGQLSEIAENNDVEVERLHAQGKRLDRILDIVTTRLDFIEVLLASRHDPNQVFDRLNVQGQDLTVLDLVRNEIFRVFKDNDEAATTFYRSDWEKFEAALLAPLARLRKDEEWTVEQYRARESQHKTGFWYPFALTLDPDVPANPKRIFRALRDHWETLSGDPAVRARKIVDELKRYVPVYNAITYGVRPPIIESSSELWRRVSRIHEYEIQASAYGYLFQILDWVFRHPEDEGKVCQCLDVVESYVMRRALCNDDASIKNVFNPAWRVANFDPLLLQYQLDDNSRPFYGDDDVRERMTSGGANFYRMGQRARYFMVERERVHSPDPYQPTEPHLDHVMPQNLGAQWPGVDPEAHQEVLHTVGNIVLLTGISNKLKSNRSWAETREVFRRSLTKEPQSLAEREAWTIESIRERGATLANWAIDRWPKPQIGNKAKIAEQMRANLVAEQARIEERLTGYPIRFGFLRKTKSVSSKSNITTDAALRAFLRSEEIHDFDAQPVGRKHAERVQAYFFTPLGAWEETQVAFYRVKDGAENRVWPIGLHRYASQWAVVGVCKHEEKVLLFNASNPSVLEAFTQYLDQASE